jgi:hypothetical protein
MMTLVWDADLPPMEKLVLLALADAANDEGHCWPSATTVMRKSGQGERTVRRCIQSLIKNGHLTQRIRSGTSSVFTVHPCHSGTPATAAPLPDRPDTPATAAPKPLRTTNGLKAKASKPKPIVPKFIRPSDIPAEPWQDFVQMRNRIGKPMTERAKELAVTRLRKLRDDDGWPPGDVLNHSTLNSYQGLFPPRDRHNERPDNPIAAAVQRLSASH